MPLGRAFETASVSLLLNKLVSTDVLEFFLKWNLDSALLRKLEMMLLIINAVLNHADEKQVEDPQVKKWLDDVKDAGYDAEDILDEICTDAFKSQYSNNQVRNFVYDSLNASDSCKEAIDFKMKDVAASVNPFGETIDSKMRNIIERLEDITKQKDILRLREDVKGNLSVIYESPTTPFVNESRVYGREGDKRDIIELLISSNEGNKEVRVIPIVGMGGVGKTTLAQIVFKDGKVMNHFNLMAWACVSDEFDVMRITKTLVESATKNTCHLNNLELLQEKLKNILNKKKFLLVLDDVWNDNFGNWDALRLPLEVGEPGSCIIVTTRNEKVAAIMGTVSPYYLKELSKDDCWLLLEQIAFPYGDSDAHPNLKVIGEEMAKKCKGLPLAAMVLGGLLRSKPGDENHWKDILHSKMWENMPNNNILPVLRLSYYHLPADLKRCFAYCSMFPKDYIFDMETLILLWMAEGFVQQQEGNKRTEEVCCHYFYDLLSRSFFQQFSGDKSRFMMHDLIHDLAQFVSGKFCIRLEDKMEVVEQVNVPEKARHLSYTRGDNDIFLKFEPFSKAKCLRTFLPLDALVGFNLWHDLSNKVLHDLLPSLRFLRVLSLRGYCITMVPDSIGNLKHLRYLDLSHTAIKELPESTSGLYNLQTLLLVECRSLTKLTTDMGTLINLRHLKTDGSNLLQMPLRMGRLKFLQTLSNFVVGEGSGSGIGELKDLLHLHGKLSISGLKNVVSVRDAIEAKLEVKKHLDELILEWNSSIHGARNESIEAEVLDALQPHEELKRLTIRYYAGAEFPIWMGDPLFNKMVYLHLYGCIKCVSLPSLGQLPLLKDLKIEGMDGIELVGLEFYTDGCSSDNPFPSLERLKFENMKEWKKWSSFEDGGVGGFPCLRELSIFRCPKLNEFLHQFSSLEVLHVQYCEELTTFSMISSQGDLEFEEFPRLRRLSLVGCTKLNGLPNSFPSLEGLRVEGCEQLAALPRLVKLCDFELLDSNVELLGSLVDLCSLTSLHINKISTVMCLPEGFLQQSAKLKQLKIVSCGDLVAFSNDHMGLKHLASLQSLTVSHCPKLVALPDEEKKLPPMLEYLDVSHCHNLQKLPDELYNLKSLRELKVEDCPKLEFFPDKGLPSMLKRLIVQRCNSLKTLPGQTFCNNISLEHFDIGYCSSLVSFLEQGELPTTLKYIKIHYCKSLKFLPEGIMHKDMSLEYLEIDNCSSLQSFPTGQLPTTLKHLEIGDCILLQSLPVSLLNLMYLEELGVTQCPLLEYFPAGGWRTTNLRKVRIAYCEKLKSLPDRIHNLKSLQELDISGCCSLTSLPKQGLPTKLRFLTIDDCESLNPLHEWKLHKLTFLKFFSIGGCPHLESFPSECLLPHSITELRILQLPDLKSLSKGLQKLTSLEKLLIRGCDRLESLPEEGLPATLSSLIIRQCPLLKPRCEKGGKDWSKIAAIPDVELT